MLRPTMKVYVRSRLVEYVSSLKGFNSWAMKRSWSFELMGIPEKTDWPLRVGRFYPAMLLFCRCIERRL